MMKPWFTFFSHSKGEQFKILKGLANHFYQNNPWKVLKEALGTKANIISSILENWVENNHKQGPRAAVSGEHFLSNRIVG